ncbi:hypothetical protein GQ53DRAFT_30152 [Thozetella sp. PMI_491]|nr:hypothetical protein GQ53DRAFT_30152 [Thozetella sp. PMI_491]
MLPYCRVSFSHSLDTSLPSRALTHPGSVSPPPWKTYNQGASRVQNRPPPCQNTKLVGRRAGAVRYPCYGRGLKSHIRSASGSIGKNPHIVSVDEHGSYNCGCRRRTSSFFSPLARTSVARALLAPKEGVCPCDPQKRSSLPALPRNSSNLLPSPIAAVWGARSRYTRFLWTNRAILHPRWAAQTAGRTKPERTSDPTSALTVLGSGRLRGRLPGH